MPQEAVVLYPQKNHYKTCPRCKHEYPATFNHFNKARSGTGKIRLDGWCKTCRRAYQKDLRDTIRADPNLAEMDRARKRKEMKIARAKNPEKYRKYQRDYYKKVKADPERNAALLEAKRIKYRLALEREGKTVTRRVEPKYKSKDTDIYLSIEPLRPILEELILLRDGVDSAAEYLGISAETIHRSLYKGKKFIQLTTADKICTELSIPFAALYPL